MRRSCFVIAALLSIGLMFLSVATAGNLTQAPLPAVNQQNLIHIPDSDQNPLNLTADLPYCPTEIAEVMRHEMVRSAPNEIVLSSQYSRTNNINQNVLGNHTAMAWTMVL